MRIQTSRFKRTIRFLSDNLSVSVMSFLVWSLYSLYVAGPGRQAAPVDKGTLLIFACAAALVTTGLLHLTDYFIRIRVLPRRSDLLLAAAVTPFGGLLAYWGLLTLGKSVPLSLFSLGFLTPALAYLIFGTQFGLEWYVARNGRPKRVVLSVLPHEAEELIRLYKAMGYEGCIKFLYPSDLRKAFLRRNEDSIDQIIISRGAVRRFDDDAFLVRAHLAGVLIVDRREVVADITGRISENETDSWSYLVTATRQTPFLRLYAGMKILVEPVIAFALAVVLAPVILAVAAAVKLTSSGPVLYRQKRTGYLGRSFELVKFRSMRTDSETSGPKWCGQGDDRITPVGKFIRRTRLDELPQLWNVIRGEMSFFGPRPERPEFYPILKEGIPLFSVRTIVRPGITGWAQVCAGYAASLEESRVKLEHDLYYIKHMSLRFDMIILVRTLKVALLGSERARTMPPVELSRRRAIPAPEPARESA